MMSEQRFKQFGLWIIDGSNSNVNSVADLIDAKLLSITEVVDLLNNICEITFTYPNLVGEIEIGKLLVDMALNGENVKVVIDDE